MKSIYKKIAAIAVAAVVQAGFGTDIAAAQVQSPVGQFVLHFSGGVNTPGVLRAHDGRFFQGEHEQHDKQPPQHDKRVGHRTDEHDQKWNSARGDAQKGRYDEISQLEYEKRLEQENRRYEQELKRRPGESDKDWKMRKKAEKQRHEKIVKDLKRIAKGKK